jgi:predicted nucleic acid-binding protein
MRYLADTSALVRIARGQAGSEWNDVVDRGLVAICEPVLIETLTAAPAKAYERTEEDLRRTYPWVPVVDEVWSMVTAVRRDLAGHGQHRGLSIADYLILATAIKLKLVLLHEDADFETVARIVPQLREQRLSSTPAGGQR